jgi:tellurite resistance protein
MNWLSNSTLVRLRDQLRSRGQRPSIVMSRPANAEAAALAQAVADFGALCEAMYLMMSADGHVTNDEREVLKGALRNLSFDEVRGIHIEAMLDEAARHVAEQGREKRLQSVVAELAEDPMRAEIAFVLAAAVSFADNVIADEENDLLSELAEGLGIDEERANALLDQAEADMQADRTSGA